MTAKLTRPASHTAEREAVADAESAAKNSFPHGFELGDLSVTPTRTKGWMIGSRLFGRLIEISSSGFVRQLQKPISQVIFDTGLTVASGAASVLKGNAIAEPVNRGGIYDQVTGRFNAPVDGIYKLHRACAGQIGSSSVTGNMKFRKNAGPLSDDLLFYNSAYNGGAIDVLVEMNKGDYLEVVIEGTGGEGFTITRPSAIFELVA